ncbi:MAG TPA: M56 family metallopeptidase [Candidatus Elarobacter sp.]|nr:M56 family metallopeptidase [Candidatus Elarobacter sp.]
MDAVLLATLNALWQGAALVTLVMLALSAGLRRTATTACVVWSVTFLIVAALPILDLTLARPHANAIAAPAVLAPVAADARLAPAIGRRTTRFEPPVAPKRVAAPAPVATRSIDVDGSWRAAAAGATKRADALLTEIGSYASRFARAWGLAIIAAWSVVVAALLLRLGLAYVAVVRVKRDATPLDDPTITARLRAAGHWRRATVASSDEIEIPCAIGFHHPMILIPSALVASLDRDDLARIVLHESAHLQRYDDCVNALEQIVCAVQFFQPALYLARRRIDFEREVACDDRVLEDSGEPLRYAECLAQIVQRQVRGRQVAVVPGFVLRRAQVVARVRRIVDRSRDASPHLRFGAVVLGGAVLATTLGIARLQVPLVAPVAAETVAPATSPAPAAAPIAPVRRVLIVRPAVKVRIAGSPLPRVRVLRAANQQPAIAPAPPEVIVIRAPRSVLRVAPRAVTLPPIDVPRFAPVAASVPVAPRPRLRTIVIVPLREVSVPELRVSMPEVHLSVPVSDEHISAPDVHVSSQLRFSAASVRVLAQAPDMVVVAPSSRRDDLLAAIDEAKYPHPSVDELIALKNHGVSGSFVRAMGALGAARPTIAQLVQLADQGINAAYFGAMQRDLATPPTLDQIVELRSQGVSAGWLEAFAASGYPKLSVADAIALAQQGIPASYVHGLADAGLKGLTPAQLISLRNHGVDASFIRHLNEHGYRNFNVDELIRLRDSGF